MKRIISTLFLSASAAAYIMGCGGSNGDGDSFRNVSGTWSGALTKVSDTCAPAGPAVINFSHVVNQNEEAVTLIASGVTYLGNLVGNDGLSVDGSTSTVKNCQDSNRIEYDSVADDDDTTANIDLRVTRTCGANQCVIAYTGTASRTGIPSGNPTVTPAAGSTATPTPTGGTQTAGGCGAINPRTVAGTFAGDGGCGISSAGYRYEQQTTENVVILEPFGSNGATTFVVSPANTSSATTRRTDLTILSQPGYVCSMACSAPSTFTVSCTKEGGTSCIEKF